MNSSQLYDRSRAFAQVVGARAGRPLRIAITVDPNLSADPTAQLIAAAVCNLLPRISERYTSIDVGVPPKQNVTIPRVAPGSLFAHLQETLNAACLGGRFGTVQGVGEAYDFYIVIGAEPNFEPQHSIYGWSSGWRCFASKGKPPRHVSQRPRMNPFAALATAALLVMMLYYDAEGVFEQNFRDEIRGWSLFDYRVSDEDGPPLPESINVGRLIQAGLGGTANALLWALRHGPDLSGEWHSFEHEMLELTNGNRYTLMDARDQGSKAWLARVRFGSVHPGLNFQVAEARIEERVRDLSDANIVLATVDSPQVRVALQAMRPPVILNVGTNAQGLSMSRHVLRDILAGHACLECLYGPAEQAPRRQRESTVSFVVALVGALLGAEMVKSIAFPESALANSWVANIFYPCEGRIMLREASPGCRTCLAIRNKGKIFDLQPNT